MLSDWLLILLIPLIWIGVDCIYKEVEDFNRVTDAYDKAKKEFLAGCEDSKKKE